MKRLGVNIDHVATLRNARGESHPNPFDAAKFAKKAGADSITIHLREDRRHIVDRDLIEIKKNLDLPLNLEIAATKEMLNIALKNKPDFICFVPEKREEITTEGGLNLKYNKTFLKLAIKKLKKKGIRVSLFIEPNYNDIKLAKKFYDADCVEIHTGKICNLINKNKNYKKQFKLIKDSAKLAKSIGLEVHAGHGLTYASAKILSKIKGIEEFNIGHFLVGESIFEGMPSTIKRFKRILKL